LRSKEAGIGETRGIIQASHFAMRARRPESKAARRFDHGGLLSFYSAKLAANTVT
jgi:hypothetical protein